MDLIALYCKRNGAKDIDTPVQTGTCNRITSINSSAKKGVD